MKAAIERYQLAFGNASVTEDSFGRRNPGLSEQATALRARQVDAAYGIAGLTGPPDSGQLDH